MTSRRPPFPGQAGLARAARVAGLAVLAAALSCRGGCGWDRSQGGPAGGRLALMPVETRLVAALDLARLRGTPVVDKLAALAAQGAAADKARIDAFAQRTGLDPRTQIDSVLFGFPDEARRHGEIGVIVRASHLDEARLVAYVRDSLQERGDDLVATRRGHRILWSARKDPGVAGFFLDDRTFVLGAGGWAEKMADLSDGAAPPGASAESNAELKQLTDRVAREHAIWAAAVISDEARRRFQADPELRGASAVRRMALGIDLGGGARDDAGAGGGLSAVLTADLERAAEAQALAAKVTETLRDAKRNALVLMTGLGPDLDGVTTRADGTTFRVGLSLNEAQVADLLERAAAFLELARRGAAPGFPLHR